MLDEMVAYAKNMAYRLGMEPDDAVGEARLELVQTVQRLDATRDTGFAGYAFPAVKGAILDAAAKRKKSQMLAFAARVVRRELPNDDDANEGNVELSLEPPEPHTEVVEVLRSEIVRALPGSTAPRAARERLRSQLRQEDPLVWPQPAC